MKAINYKHEDAIRIFEEASQICAGLQLVVEYGTVKWANESNQAPYHNWYHLNCIVKLCYEAATYYHLPYNSVRALIYAALMHDVNHSMGKEKDSVNICEAIICAKQVGQTANPPIDLNLVERLIRTTEYSYVIDCFSIEQRIIRDCDLLQVTMPQALEMCVYGLAEEMGITDMKKAIQGQIAFMSRVKNGALTEWAKPKFAQFDRIAQELWYEVMEKETDE